MPGRYRSPVELRHLRYFIGIVDAGGMARARRRLHVSQPTLSRQIRDLEHELGLRLFNRVGRTLELTAEGRELVTRGRRVMAEAEALTARSLALAGGAGGVLRIGAPPQFLEAAMPDVLRAFSRAHPAVDVQLSEEGGRRLISRIEHGDLHLAIGMLRDIGPLASRPLYPLRVLAVMSRRHPLATRRRLSVDELVDERLLLLESGFQTRQLFDEACGSRQADLHIVLESRAPQSLVALAAAGHGIAIVPSVVPLSRTRVAILGLTHRGRPLGSWGLVLWDPRRYLPPYGHAFVDVLERCTTRSYPGQRLGVTRGIERPAP
jgi:LysR family transcriptional regulator, cyn operon transcriptional activator